MSSVALDQVRLNFSHEGLIGLNLVLALVMLGVALDLKLSDFGTALKTPKALLVGLLSHHAIFPALTFGLIQILKPQPSIALGMLLVSSCPAGHISNYFTHRAGGNTALSLSISALSTIAAFFFMPLNVVFWASHDDQMRILMRDFSIDPVKMLIDIGVLLIAPLMIGLTISHRFPVLTKRLRKPMQIFSLVIFIVFVLSALGANWIYFKQFATVVMGIVFIHNALALGCGYGISRLLGISERDARAVSFETGIQNSGLGLVLIFSFFDGLGGMAIITAWWGMWHIVAGLALSTFWMKHPPKESNRAS